MTGYSARYDAALVLAARLHRNQVRKGTDVPYIAHVVHVSIILLRHGYSEDVAIAGLLHDAVEDQRYPLERIAEQFGAHVAGLVDSLSERRYEGVAVRPWETRKAEKIASLQTAGPEALAVEAADLLHNMRSIIADLRTDRAGVWARFTRGRAGSIWYYRTVADVLLARMGAHPLAAEVEAAVTELEALAAEAPPPE